MDRMNGKRQKQRREGGTKPFSQKKESNLRNLLIIGFVRNCNAPLLPTKFFDYFNFYYLQFDRWDYNFFRTHWVSKRNNLVTIKRGKRDKAIWKNMYGLKHIKFNPNTDKYPRRFSWKLRFLDRNQMNIKDEELDEDEGDVQMSERNKKKEAFEMQFVDVFVGVVDVEKMPNNQALQKAFTSYSCGYGLFGGNGKILKGSQWIRACKPLQHEETICVNIEWMKRSEFNQLYATEKNLEKSQNLGDEFIVALTFGKNEQMDEVPKGAALCLPSSSIYKLAVSSAKKRWEIEWITSNWCSRDDYQDKLMK